MKEVPILYELRIYGIKAPIEPSFVPATKKEKPQLTSLRKGGVLVSSPVDCWSV
jgi:hypothetical protein